MILIFDLDGTVIDSSHRTPVREDGTLDLDVYRQKQTWGFVSQDKLLPLARIMKKFYNQAYIIVCTARELLDCDIRYLRENGIVYNTILSRNNIPESHYKLTDGEYKKRHIRRFLNLKQFKNQQVVMFDDSKVVKSTLRSLFPVLCAHKVNKRLEGIV
jgi:hydroxymethylpyrimidine pyrophosphatase-like HAD family hydrolase